MLHETYSINKRLRGTILALLLMSLSACALFEDRTGPKAYYGPREERFYATFDEVWRAVNLVVQPYPLRVSNMDQGTLETDMIRANRVWLPPHRSSDAFQGQSYKLTIRVLKGVTDRRSLTKVTIVKDAQQQVDFFSDPRALPSDGLEEKQLLYRIGREIQIERALAKAQKKQNANPKQTNELKQSGEPSEME